MNLSELSDLTLVLIFTFSGILGIISHYVKKATRKQTTSSFLEYMLNNIWHTLSSCGSTGVALIGMLATDVDLTEVSTMAAAFMAGYVSDSVMNKDKND